MFKIQDGRKSFTQWDLNRKIIVEDDSITQVHFTNLLNKNALVSEVKNHLADVPNVLLQDYGTILIYGYDGNYTKYVEAFRVVRREKPEDYIYTETEVLNYNNLLERMNNIEGSIQQVVTDYLRENPPKVDLEGYATKEYVDNAIAAISAVDLSDYFTKEEANAKFATKDEIPSTSGLATEEFVNRKVSGLATENYVDNAVAAVPQPDLSGYALKSEIPSTAGLATEQYVNEAVSNVSVDLTGYATETYVNEAVAGIEIPEVDLSGYALKSEIPSTTGLATETYVNEAVAAIEIPEVDLSGYQEKLTAGDNITIEGNVISATGGSGGGSVAVDGTTIIQNDDGTISTALGVKKEAVPATAIYESASYECVDSGGYQIRIRDFVANSNEEEKARVVNAGWDYENNKPFGNSNTKYYFKLQGTDYDSGETYDIEVRNLTYSPSDYNGFRINTDIVTTLEFSYTNQHRIYTTAGINVSFYEIGIEESYSYSLLPIQTIPVDGTTILLSDNGLTSGAINNFSIFEKNDLYNGLSIVSKGNTIDSNIHEGSLVFGVNNNVKGTYNIVLGFANEVRGDANHSFTHGYNNKSYNNSFVYGNNNIFYQSSSQYGVIIGSHLIHDTNSMCVGSVIIGKYGTLKNSQMFGIAYGSSESSAPIFSVSNSGNVNANGTISGSGSDYAEYFEWLDGNPEGEDRVGLIVALRGDKIVLAQDGDDVLGIVSGTATVLGDNAEYTWSKIHLRDDFGRLIYEDVVFENEDGTTYTEKHPKVNPAYNPEEEYIARSKRKEWDVVGMLGKLYVRDDGTCGVGGYAKVGADGIATLSQEPTNMYVMKRTAANIVRVLFK